MSRVSRSVAMTAALDAAAQAHLLRPDRQEDLCFGLWYPSRGATRMTAILNKLILPLDNERHVHGNASFEASYFERALSEAAAAGAGLALMHSHPFGSGWQMMSEDDVDAEQGRAGAVFGATDLPFVGLTLAGDGTWSARYWERTAPKTYPCAWCGSVRVVGDSLKISYFDKLAPRPRPMETQIRTISAWGEDAQADLARLHVGQVGAGSVGGFIAESTARMGTEDMSVFDFDRIERHNLDRLNYATTDDVGRLKVEVLADYLKKRATAARFCLDAIDGAVYEEDVFRKALDCDVINACVDRPWGRYVLNFIAHAHLIPVVDGGIRIQANRFGKLKAADWRAHTATIGRPCLQCIGQYDPAFVQLEREGRLDDPKYIEGLAESHPLKMRQNVFPFSMACASLQNLQMLALTLAPLDQSDPGSQLYHFVGGELESMRNSACHAECLFPGFTALGDSSGLQVTVPRRIPQPEPRRRSLMTVLASLIGW